MRPFFAFILALALAFPGVLHPATIRVPADQPTIAAGLAAATAGDEVVLSCGTYFENGLMMKSGVTLRSETGLPDCAVIDGSTVLARVIRFFSTTGARLEGVTIRGARRGGGDIRSGSTVTITRCAFLENRVPPFSNFGAALRILASDVSISDSRFHENSAARSSGIYQRDGDLEISGCEFTFNKTGDGYGYAALRLEGAGAVSITSSRFLDNGWVLDVSRPCSITDCVFESNRGSAGRYSWGTFRFYGSPVEIIRSRFSWNSVAENGGMAPTYQFIACPSVLIESCVFHADTSFAILMAGLGETHSVRRSIFSKTWTPDVPIFECGVSISCCDFWANRGPLFASDCDWDTTAVVFSDPMFCDAAKGDFHVAGASPCLPGVSPCGELIGVMGAGCGPVSLSAQSWGGIKNLYR